MDSGTVVVTPLSMRVEHQTSHVYSMRQSDSKDRERIKILELFLNKTNIFLNTEVPLFFFFFFQGKSVICSVCSVIFCFGKCGQQLAKNERNEHEEERERESERERKRERETERGREGRKEFN